MPGDSFHVEKERREERERDRAQRHEHMPKRTRACQRVRATVLFCDRGEGLPVPPMSSSPVITNQLKRRSSSFREMAVGE